MKQYFILGLDTSTNCTGWCALPLDSSDLKGRGGFGKIITEWQLVEGFPIAAPGYYYKVDHLLRELDIIVGKYAFAAVGMELLNSFRGGETTRQLAGIQKITQYHLRNKHKLIVNEIHTQTIKSVMGQGIWKKGDGSPKKPDMVKYANARYGLDLKFSNPRKKSFSGVSLGLHITDDDVADAIGVATALREEVGAQLTRELLLTD